MVAAGCMVLYGFDAAIFNTVQANKQWLAWFDNPVRLLETSKEYFKIDRVWQSGELFGLINTTYSIGAIISGWFIAGPTVSVVAVISLQRFLIINRPITSAAGGQWELDVSLQLLLHSSRHLLHITKLVFLFSVVYWSVSAKALRWVSWKILWLSYRASTDVFLAAGPVYIGEITPSEVCNILKLVLLNGCPAGVGIEAFANFN